MVCTALSMEPWPVMMATSVRGCNALMRCKRSTPVMLGSMRSVRTTSGACASSTARAASADSASEQTKPSDAPIVMHNLRMLCSSSTIRKRTRKSSVMLAISMPVAHNFFHGGNQLLHAEGFFEAGGACFYQDGRSFFAGSIAGGKQKPGNHFRTIGRDPGMHVGAVNASGGAHV